MKIFSVLLVIALLAPAVPVRAADPEEVCLPIEAHRRITADLLELRGDPDKPGSTGLRGRVKLLDKSLTLRDENIVDLRLTTALAVQAKETAVDSLTAAVRGKREAEEARDAWHRSPALWVAIGVLGSLAIALAVDRIQADARN